MRFYVESLFIKVIIKWPVPIEVIDDISLKLSLFSTREIDYDARSIQFDERGIK